MERRSYHRAAQTIARQASLAGSPEDAVRRLGLRCGLVQRGQHTRITRDGALWRLECGGRAWRVDMTCQDFTEIL